MWYLFNRHCRFFDKIFDSAEENIWKNRLKQLIYLLNENDYKSEASKFLKLLKDDELFILFKQVIIQRSLFNNLLLLKENVKQSSLPINIFRKKMVNDEKYNVAKWRIEWIKYPMWTSDYLIVKESTIHGLNLYKIWLSYLLNN